MNDLECLKINYDVDGWQRISARDENYCCVPLGAVYAIRSLIDEVEILRELSKYLIRIYVVDDQDYDPAKRTEAAFNRFYDDFMRTRNEKAEA